jgi:amidase
VGLKPTWGRVSRYGVLALAESLDHVGPLTRSSADAGIMLQAIAGPDPNDPTSLPVPMPDILERPDRSIERIEGVRVGFDERYAVRDVDPQVSAAVVAAVKVVEGLGAEIVEVRLPDVDEIDEYVAAWSALCTAEAVAAHRATYPSRRDEYGAFFRGWLDLGAQVSGAEYAMANNARAALTGHLRTAFEHIDALACPAMPDLPGPVTPEALRSSPPVVDEGVFRLQRFTVPFDYNGAPTLTLPCGMSSEGLPLSLQLAGKPLAEPLLCRLGAAYEAATEWHHMHPDL